MNRYTQKSIGILNKQIQEFQEAKPSIEFLPNEIDDILNALIDNTDIEIGDESLTPPDLPIKNELNEVNSDYFELIEEDFIHFNSIERVIKNDPTDELTDKYSLARRILQQKYLGDYSPNFPSFVNAIIEHVNLNGGTSASAIKIVTILHYMYTECEIGRKPNND